MEDQIDKTEEMLAEIRKSLKRAKEALDNAATAASFIDVSYFADDLNETHEQVLRAVNDYGAQIEAAVNGKGYWEVDE